MSQKDRLTESLRNILKAESINKEFLVRKLREMSNTNWLITIRTEIKDRQRVCDWSCRLVFRESQLFILPCTTHQFCNDCLFFYIESKLIADPFNLQYIYCPKCEYEGNLTQIPHEFILSNFDVQDYQNKYLQRNQEYMNSDIIVREFAQPGPAPLKPQMPEEDQEIGELTMPPPLSDYSSKAVTFRSCFDMLNSMQNTVRIQLKSTKEIIKPRVKHEFYELKNQIRGTSYRAISGFMDENSVCGIAYSNFKPDEETGFFKFFKKVSQAPTKDKSYFIDCELITEGNIINEKPKKGDAGKTEYPKIYSDGDFYYVSKHEGILMLCIAQVG